MNEHLNTSLPEIIEDDFNPAIMVILEMTLLRNTSPRDLSFGEKKEVLLSDQTKMFQYQYGLDFDPAVQMALSFMKFVTSSGKAIKLPGAQKRIERNLSKHFQVLKDESSLNFEVKDAVDTFTVMTNLTPETDDHALSVAKHFAGLYGINPESLREASKARSEAVAQYLQVLNQETSDLDRDVSPLWETIQEDLNTWYQLLQHAVKKYHTPEN